MKTCLVCLQEYKNIVPISAKEYTFTDFETNGYTCQRKNNFCSTKCLQQYTSTITAYFPENKAFIASIPLDKLEMCQFCGSFTHPPEYCASYGSNQQEIEDFQNIGNLTGEWTLCRGEFLYIILGQKVEIEIEKIVFRAKMQKLQDDIIEERVPLVYFWFTQESCQDIVKDISDEIKPIELTKEIIVSVKPMLTKLWRPNPSIMILHQAKKILDPNKIFFPFDIRRDPCWWPVDQEHFAVLETCCTTPAKPTLSTMLMEYDYDSIFCYESEETKPDVELSENQKEELLIE